MQYLQSERQHAGSDPSATTQAPKFSNKLRRLNSMYHLERDETGSTVFRLAHASNIHESNEQTNTVPEIILLEPQEGADHSQSIEEEELHYPKETATTSPRNLSNDKQNNRSDIFELRIENIRERLLQGDFGSNAERTQLEQSLNRFERAKQKRQRHLHGPMTDS